MLLTIQPTADLEFIEVEFPGDPYTFAQMLGRYTPTVPTDFTHAEVLGPTNTVVLTDRNTVAARGSAIRLSHDNMTNLLTYLRSMFPHHFNLADIAASNAAYLAKNYLQQ